MNARIRRLAIGDPQASAETFTDILARHEVLDESGQVAQDVHLVSIGDHFDFGSESELPLAKASGSANLSWLLAQPSERVTVLLGNHDLGRVGELAGFDDETFGRARVAALEAYRSGDVDAEAEQELLSAYPALPTAELAARDFASFTVAQREVVAAGLSSGRLVGALAAAPTTLVTHAGVTTHTLVACGVPSELWADAPAIAAAINDRVARAWAATSPGAAMVVPGLHQPGSASLGEGLGMFYHRPANPALARNAAYPTDRSLARRYDPRDLPPGLVQVVGHISDRKCRELLGDWAQGEAARPGALRSLDVSGGQVSYQAGLPVSARRGARMIFIDGAMSRVPASDYELLDLDSV